MKIDLDTMNDRGLLSLFGEVMGELRRRGVVRSSNSPAADYAEALVAKALQLQLNTRSTAGFDGVDIGGRRIEIKCRRLTPENDSRQLSAIRGIEHAHFDFLAGVLFAPDFSVIKAALVPFEQVKACATYVPQTNSWRFMLRDSVWKLPGVEDITARLQAAQA